MLLNEELGRLSLLLSATHIHKRSLSGAEASGLPSCYSIHLLI